MAYTMSGKVTKLFPLQEFPSGFSKREFVVRTEERFPQEVKFECLKEKAELLDSVKEEDEVTVHFDIRGREWNDRYFVNLAAWKIDAGDGEKAGGRKAAEEPAVPAEDPAEYPAEDEDIPF